MFTFDFFSQPINAELATLIVCAPLAEEEKQAWLRVLPLMGDDQKNELIANLKAEIKDFVELEKTTLEQVYKKAEEILEKQSN